MQKNNLCSIPHL